MDALARRVVSVGLDDDIPPGGFEQFFGRVSCVFRLIDFIGGIADLDMEHGNL